MPRILAVVLLVLAFAFPAAAVDISPTSWISFSDVHDDGTREYSMPNGLWIVGSDWTGVPVVTTFTAFGMFDTSGLTLGDSFYFNVVITDFYLPNGNGEPQAPDILRSTTVSSYVDDGVMADDDFGKGTPFVLVDFPQLRGAAFSFEVSDQVNAAIGNGDQWLTFVFAPNWDVTADRTTFTFGTPDNPFLYVTPLGDFGVISLSTGIYSTLGDQAFGLASSTPVIPEPASIALLAVGTLLLRRKR